MAYDDGFYYGQCKIICEAETIAYNGKTVTVTNGTISKSGVIADKVFECLVPGRGQYTISVLDGGTTLWSGTVEAGYGECIHQMLADGYEAIIEKSKLTLAEIEAAPGSVADYVPDADAVKTLNSNLTANSQPFRYGYDSASDKYGYIREVDGADTFFPFSSSLNEETDLYEDMITLTSQEGYAPPYNIRTVIVPNNSAHSLYLATSNGGNWGTGSVYNYQLLSVSEDGVQIPTSRYIWRQLYPFSDNCGFNLTMVMKRGSTYVFNFNGTTGQMGFDCIPLD